MKSKIIVFLIGMCVNVFGEVRLVQNTGTGPRAMAMGNSQIAAASDLSALYWNPGALAFIPVREFQISLDFLNLQATTGLYGTIKNDELQRIRLGNIGLLYSLPTVRGGFTLGGLFHNPYVFDDALSFDVTYPSGSDTIHTQREYRVSGGLKYWTGGFGVQIARGVGVGGAVSLVTGSEQVGESFTRTENGTIIDRYSDNFLRSLINKYLGYDIRAGILGEIIQDRLQAGLLVALPQFIRFNGNDDVEYPSESSSSQVYETEGRIISSYTGGIGLCATLPLLTISTDLTVRAPYSWVFPTENIPETSPASNYKVGWGIGVEVPITSILLRAGYSAKEMDPFTFVTQNKGERMSWDDEGISSASYVNQLSAGVGYVTGSLSLDAAYSLQLFNPETQRNLAQDNQLHRFALSLALRF